MVALNRPVEVLLVEDNPADVKVAHAIIRDANIDIWVLMNVVPDGEQALAYLRRSGSYEKARRPDLVLLDLNLPKVTGMEVLAEMRRDPAIENIPVVVLTGSTNDRDRRLAEEMGCYSFITKSPDIGDYDQVLAAIKDIAHALMAEAGLASGA